MKMKKIAVLGAGAVGSYVIWGLSKRDDISLGVVAEGEDLDTVGKRLFDEVVAVASGKEVKSEIAGFHDMAIFKQGVTL